ncbi:MAG: CBS domain-containing protein [Chloroflexi bacterium]|nr:CBS domain-containing protein [Chloroflexota bacterium]
MQVKDAATTAVHAVRPYTKLGEILQLLLEQNISGVPVVEDDGTVVGVVTETDLIQRIKTPAAASIWWHITMEPTPGAQKYLKEHGHTAEELMSCPPICVTEELPLGDAVALMYSHRINRLPVVRGGRLVGVLTRADVLRALVSGARIDSAERALRAGDAEIEAAVRRALYAQPWVPLADLRVEAVDGRVRLRGTVPNEVIARAMERLTRDIPGVGAVDSDLTTIAPRSQANISA